MLYYVTLWGRCEVGTSGGMRKNLCRVFLSWGVHLPPNKHVLIIIISTAVQYSYTSYPENYDLSYDEVQLPFKAGGHGHGIRPWAAHGDTASIGQWALSTQTAWSGELVRSYFPVLTDVIERAALPAPANAGEDRLADDLRGAWARSLATLDLLPRTSTAEQSRLVEVSGWAEATNQDIRRLILIQLFQLLISAFPLLNSAVTRSHVKSRFSVIFKEFFKQNATVRVYCPKIRVQVDQKRSLIYLRRFLDPENFWGPPVQRPRLAAGTRIWPARTESAT